MEQKKTNIIENGAAPGGSTSSNMKTSRKSGSRAFRAGGFSALATIIVIAIAAVVVFCVDQLPTTLTKIDTTANKLFSLSGQSKQIAKNVTDELDIYIVAQPSNEDALLIELLERYASQNSKIKIKRVDPIVSPNFLSQYTTDYLYENSLVLTYGERYKYISYHDVYATDYQNYSVNGEVLKSFNGEDVITSAIDYVMSERLPKAYKLTGHGEAVMTSAVRSAISLENIALEDLSLLTLDAVPADCEALVIYSPKSDLSDDETKKILAYLDDGGRLLMITDGLTPDMKNLLSIAAHYGLSAAEGIVVEGDQNYSLRGYYHYLLPEIVSHTITTPLRIGTYFVLMPLAQGIVISDAPRESVTVSTLLSTSNAAYSKADGYAMLTLEKEEGDLDGPFALGIAVTEDCGDGKETRLVWYTTSEMFQDETDTLVSGANKDLLLNSLDWMCEREGSIAVHAKSVASTQLTVPTADATRWSLVMILAIPLAIIAAGIFVVVRRKRR